MPARGASNILLPALLSLCLIVIAPVCRAAPAIEEAFSPDQGATALVLRTINDAHHSIRVAAYTFTSWPIAHALADAARHGVDVRVVLDQGQLEHSYSVKPFLQAHGVSVRTDAAHAIMHDKFMIMDGETLELGSFNYTKAAEHENAENVLVLRDAGPTAVDYNRQWERLWAESR